jgi:hypothetical protein
MVYVVDLPSYTISESEKESILSWIEQLNNLEKTRTDQEVYVQLTLIFNLLEHKKNTNDAIRKWIEDRLGQIISLLNNRSFSSSFNLESVQFLVEYCHARNFLA